jgi:hypothetical protein
LPHLRIYAHTVERVLKQAGSSLGQGPPLALS